MTTTIGGRFLVWFSLCMFLKMNYWPRLPVLTYLFYLFKYTFFFCRQFMLAGISTDWFCVDAGFITPIQTGKYNPIAVFVNKCRAEALIATLVGEWVEAHCFHPLHTFLNPSIHVVQSFIG